MEKYDLGIIGAGPAGYTAAFHAREKGLRVVLFEKEKVGGVCLNKGCIPTKAILHSSEVFSSTKSCDEFGICFDGVKVDFAKVIEHKNKIVEKIRKSLELSLKNSKVLVINAQAELIDAKTIKANDEIYHFKKIIVATGSEPKSLPNLSFDHKFILSSDDILEMCELPKSILIVGSGAIGIEWARIFSNFGVETVVVEFASNLLPLADIEVSKRLERIFKAQKIKFYTNTVVENIDKYSVKLSNGEVIQPERILLAVGRKPNECPKISGVAYLGDVCGSIQLAHFAIKQAISEITGVKFNQSLVPSVVYGCPEIAWVGKREQDLESETYQKSNLLISVLGKSHCDNCTDGFIKILSQDGRIVGAHVISKEASALVQQLTIAIQNNVTVDQLKEVCFAHPTYSEGIFESLWRLG